MPENTNVFKNIISTTLHNALIIHCLFQSLPQIILQSTNNLMIQEDKHDFEMKGVVNFYSITSMIVIGFLIVLYLRERSIINNKEREEEEKRMGNYGKNLELM